MSRSRNLALGSTLIAVGVLFLLDALKVPVLAELWRAWPLVLVGFGAAKLLHHKRGLPSRLRAPERLLVVLVTLAGVIVSLAHDRPASQTDGDRGSMPDGEARPIPVELRETEKRTVPITPGQTLHMDVTGADLEIVGGASTMVLATVSVPRRGSLPEPALSVETASDGPEVRYASARGPDPGGRPRVRLVVPSATRVVVEHADGDVVVRDVGPLEIEGQGSNVSLERIQGAVRVELANGSLDVEVVSGDLDVDAEVTNVKAVGLGARATIHTRYGNVELEGVAGSVDVMANDGTIRAQGIAGAATVHGLRSPIELRAVRGAVSVESVEGSVTLEGIESSADIDGRAARIEVTGAQGPLTVKTTLADVTLFALGASIAVQVEDGDVTVRDCQGRVDIDVRHGEVAIERIAGGGSVRVEDGNVAAAVLGGSLLELSTKQGNVTLAMGRMGARLSLEASPGAIQNHLDQALPIEVQGAVASLHANVRSGGGPVTVAAHHGLIRIQD